RPQWNRGPNEAVGRRDAVSAPTSIRKRLRMLLYVCPVTGREQRSDIQTSPARLARLGTLKISLWCPHCNLPHLISPTDLTGTPCARKGGRSADSGTVRQ